MKRFNLMSGTRLLLFVLLATALIACTGITPDSATEATPPPAESTAVAPPPETLPPTVPTVESTAVPSSPESTASLDCEFLPEILSDGQESVVIPESAVVVVRKEGGFAGLVETWVIYAHGLITKDSGEQWQVPAQIVEDLVVLANEAGFYDLEANYVPQDNCCDHFIYVVTVRDCEQVHTVTAIENAPEVPGAVWDLIHIFEEMLSGGSTTGVIAPGNAPAS